MCMRDYDIQKRIKKKGMEIQICWHICKWIHKSWEIWFMPSEKKFYFWLINNNFEKTAVACAHRGLMWKLLFWMNNPMLYSSIVRNNETWHRHRFHIWPPEISNRPTRTWSGALDLDHGWKRIYRRDRHLPRRVLQTITIASNFADNCRALDRQFLSPIGFPPHTWLWPYPLRPCGGTIDHHHQFCTSSRAWFSR